MPWISSTHLGGGTGVVGKMFASRPTTGTLANHRELTLPTAFKVTQTRPSVVGYNGRAYYTGLGSDNALVDEHYRALRQGLLAPNVVPTLAASGTGVTGSAVVAIAWWDMFTDEWSPLSASSGAVALANQGRSTGNIPAVPNDDRATHVGIFVSMDGAAFRLSTKRQIGVTTVVENVATLSLASITGITSGDAFERFPRGTINTIYHDRQVVAGDSRHPDTVYLSEVGFPERYIGLSFRTRTGQPVVGLAANNDVCLVFTPFGFEVLRGWTNSDMTMTQSGWDLGCCAHSTIQVIDNRIYWANEKGVWLYNGAPHLILKDRQAEWEGLYKNFRNIFEDAYSVVDPNENTYSIVLGFVPSPGDDGVASRVSFDIPDPNATNPFSIAWVCDYSSIAPEQGGSMSQPAWFFDVWQRHSECAALLSIPGSKRRDPYYGFADGFIRKYGITTDSEYANDDGDTYDKMMWIRTKAYDMDDPGGDSKDGKTLISLWSYLRAEVDAWTVYCQGGDEEAYNQILPDNANHFWKEDVAAGKLVTTGVAIPETTVGVSDTVTYAPLSVHPHLPYRVHGRSFTLQYKISNPVNVRWRGFGGVYGPGDASRLPVTILSGS
jgi:hypothetical protein